MAAFARYWFYLKQGQNVHYKKAMPKIFGEKITNYL